MFARECPFSQMRACKYPIICHVRGQIVHGPEPIRYWRIAVHRYVFGLFVGFNRAPLKCCCCTISGSPEAHSAVLIAKWKPSNARAAYFHVRFSSASPADDTKQIRLPHFCRLRRLASMICATIAQCSPSPESAACYICTYAVCAYVRIQSSGPNASASASHNF